MSSMLGLFVMTGVLLQVMNGIICDGNRFLFVSNYVLSRQKDLNETFNELNTRVSVS